MARVTGYYSEGESEGGGNSPAGEAPEPGSAGGSSGQEVAVKVKREARVLPAWAGLGAVETPLELTMALEVHTATASSRRPFSRRPCLPAISCAMCP